MSSFDRRIWLKQAAAGSLLCATSSPAIRGAEAPSESSRPIRAGQIGVAHAHASGKMSTMRSMSELYDVVGVVEPDERRWNAVRESPAYRGIPRVTEAELLGDRDLQVVAVETEVNELVPAAARCIAAGKHVHLDKPAGESLDEFQRLLDSAKHHQRTIQMGYMFRYNRAFQFLFRAVRDGWLGEVFEVHGVISKSVGDDSRRALARYAGGSMFELGCHLIDALLVLLGPPERVIPYVKRTRSRSGAPRQDVSDDLADNQLAVFEFAKATATIRSSLVEIDGARRRQFVVCGTLGTIEIKPLEPPELTLTLDRPRGEFNQGTQVVRLAPLGGRYDGDFLDLAQIVRGEKPPDYSPQHDLAVQRAVLLASGLALEPK